MGKLNRGLLSRSMLGLVAAFLTAGSITALADEQPASDLSLQASKVDIWPKVRTGLFGTRPIRTDGEALIELETPKRAEDAAVVPVAIRSRVPQSAGRYIDKIYLLVDRNPSPIAAVFQFTPESGRADIETRIRIEEYTDVRAVAEMNDGELYMVSNYVKAAGGCSAPAGKDAAAALANAGRMKFHVQDAVVSGEPTLAQIAISHPNASGLVLDQVSRLYAPSYYVRKLTVSYAGKVVMTADVDFSISENPNFRFYFVPRGEGELTAEIVDTKDLIFDSKVAVRPQRLASGS